MGAATLAQSQDLSGKWTGALTQSVNGQKKEYYFELQLHQEGYQLRGASIVAANDKTTATSLVEGTWENGEIQYQELKFIKIRDPKGTENWCLKQMSLTYKLEGDVESLTGTWERGGGCGKGDLTLSRKAQKPPQQEVFKTNDQTLAVQKVKISLQNPNLSAFIEIRDANTGELMHRGNISAKEFDLELPAGYYDLWVHQQGYLHIQTTEVVKDKPNTWEYRLEPIRKGDKFVIKGLYFEQSRAIITMDSKPALARLAQFLKDNPACRIRIVGHTDNIGNAYLNRILSLNRARAVAKYLVVEAGIVGNRLLPPKGKGGDEPLVEAADASGHSRNRRVEVEIVEVDP